MNSNYEILKDKLTRRMPVCMTNLMVVSSPLMLQACTEADCVLLDKEHGIYGSEELVPMTLECRHLKLPSIVRVEDSIYHLIAKAIDLGADGIMLPRVESLEQVKAGIDGMHFLPEGRTGFGGWGLQRDGETLEEFQRGRILMIQIESAAGKRLIPDMVKRYGQYIDAFIIGPNDYSFSMGLPTQTTHPAVQEEIRQVFDICGSLGKSCGCYAPTPEIAVQYVQMGANVSWVGSDLDYFAAGIRRYLDVIPGYRQEI